MNWRMKAKSVRRTWNFDGFQMGRHSSNIKHQPEEKTCSVKHVLSEGSGGEKVRDTFRDSRLDPITEGRNVESKKTSSVKCFNAE